MLGGTVHDGLDALHVRLPGTVGASVRMADLNAEGHILVAELAFCHSLKHLLASVVLINSSFILAEGAVNCKKNFHIRVKKLKFLCSRRSQAQKRLAKSLYIR